MISRSVSQRLGRKRKTPLVNRLRAAPGELSVTGLSPGLPAAMHHLAQVVFVSPFPGATFTRGERELLAAYAAATLKCISAVELHTEVARHLLRKENHPRGVVTVILREMASNQISELDPRLQAAITLLRRALGALPGAELSSASADLSKDDCALVVLIARYCAMAYGLVELLQAPLPRNKRQIGRVVQHIVGQGYLPLAPEFALVR